MALQTRWTFPVHRRLCNYSVHLPDHTQRVFILWRVYLKCAPHHVCVVCAYDVSSSLAVVILINTVKTNPNPNQYVLINKKYDMVHLSGRPHPVLTSVSDMDLDKVDYLPYRDYPLFYNIFAPASCIGCIVSSYNPRITALSFLGINFKARRQCQINQWWKPDHLRFLWKITIGAHMYMCNVYE